MMTEVLKTELVAAVQFLDSQEGKHLTIIDRVTHNANNYDRHFTSTSIIKIKLESFRVRTSGAIAMLEGSDQSFQFRTSVQKVLQTENQIIFEIGISEQVTQLIEINIADTL